MVRPNVKWRHSSEELKRAYKQERRGEIKIMILALWKISEGSSIKSISETIGYAYNAVHSWLKIYNNYGLQGLIAKKIRKKGGGKCRLSDEQVIEIRKMYRSGELPTINEAIKYVENHYKITYSHCGLSRILSHARLYENC